MIDCNWDHPGTNPYSGSPTAAIMQYVEIPVATRTLLAKRAEVKDYDDVVFISKDEIHGRDAYSTDLRDMHFGKFGMCHGPVTRSAWLPSRIESGMVFCEGQYCVVRPSVCNNWALITRTESVAPPALPALGVAGIPDTAGPTLDYIPSSFLFNDYIPTPGDDGYGFTIVGPAPVFLGGGGEAPGPMPMSPPISAIPEPATRLLIVVGLGAVLRVGRRLT